MILVVDGQRIYNYEYQEPPPIATNSLGFIEIEFRLSEEWDGHICTAQFVQHKESGPDFVASKVLYNNHVTFPDGIVPGVLEISLFGYKAGEAERGTTFPYLQPVYRSGFTSTEATPIPPTPDLYAQLIEQFSKIPAELLKGKVDKFQGTENAGKSLYIRGDGKIMPLSLGRGFTVTDGVLESTNDGLSGNTRRVTPQEVYNAINEERPIMIAHTTEEYGIVQFNYFAYLPKNGSLVATAVGGTNNENKNGQAMLFRLRGNRNTNEWTFDAIQLAKKSDIPPSVGEGGGSAKPWLKGTTSEITPAQVVVAITENDQSVMIYHEADEYGLVGFSNFVVSVDGNGVAASVVFQFGGEGNLPVYYTLIGMVDSGMWTVDAGMIADAQTVAKELDSMDQMISRMEQKKADREYIVRVFEELKALILAGDTGGAVALLDQAILDQAVLA